MTMCLILSLEELLPPPLSKCTTLSRGSLEPTWIPSVFPTDML